MPVIEKLTSIDGLKMGNSGLYLISSREKFAMTSFKDFIEQVKDQADIVDIIRQYVPLKKSGTRFLGLCPFHHDRSPSLNVTPQMGIYKCFACGAGGDVLRFVQDYEKIDFIDALKSVAERSGLSLPEDLGKGESSGEREKSSLILKANSVAGAYYRKQLEHCSEALEYLRGRGLSEATVSQFQLGYAPENPEGLLQRAAQEGINRQILIEAGILGQGADGRIYDRFHGRLLFPIWNMTGHIVAFGGRVLKAGGQPKYVNSAESALYQKSRILYGIHFARNAMDASRTAVVVEGYMDLLSLWQAGIHNAVAVSGTALTGEHVRVLARFAGKALLFFDGDEAGRKAVKRSLPALLAAGVEVRIPELSPEHDPDSFVREKGLEGTQRLFGESANLVQFLTSDLSTSGLSPEQRNALFEQCVETIGQIPAPMVRSEYLGQLAKRFELKTLPLTVRFAAGAAPARLAAEIGDSAAAEARMNLQTPGWQLLRLLLSSEELCRKAAVGFELSWVDDPAAQALIDHLLAYVEEEGQLDLRGFLERLPQKDQGIVARMDVEEAGEASEETLFRLEREYLDIVTALEIRHIQRCRREEKDLVRQMELQRRLRELNQSKLKGWEKP